MIVVYNEILDRINNPVKYKNSYAQKNAKPLIEYYKEENIQSSSYDVSISNKILAENASVETINLSSEASVKSIFHEINIKNGYILKPGEFILVQLNEIINMPDDLCAHIRPRTTYNRLGLMVIGQHINPSYSGILQLGVKNITSYSFNLVPGIRIGQIVFEKLSDKIPEDKLYRNTGTSKYQNEGKDFITSKVYDDADIKAAKELYNLLLSEKE